MTARTDSVPGIGVAAARELLDGDAEMIDVRDAHEWRAGHSPHSVHVPLDGLSTASNVLSHVHTLVVVSRSGRRAAEAVLHLRAAGCDAVRLEGGLHAWRDAGLPLVSDTGRPARVI